MDYAVIRVGGKQHKVRDGETLVVDRVRTDVGETFEPDVLLGDGTKVVVTVLAHERGPKIRIGKYRRRTGYKRHNGFRAATSRIEVTIGAGKKRAKAKAKPETEAPVEVEATEAEETAVAAAAVEETQAEETQAEAVAVEETEAEEDAVEEAPAGLPDGYADMTVAEIGKQAKSWDHDQLETARTYEEAHAARKGALTAIDHALAAEDTDDEKAEES
jgi:large subunit ribosomal protein L21